MAVCLMCPHPGDKEDASEHGRSPNPLKRHWGQHRFASWWLQMHPSRMENKQSLRLHSASTWSLVFPPVFHPWRMVALICCPGCIFFFFPLSHVRFILFLLLIRDGNSSSEMMNTPSVHRRVPYSPCASDRGIFSLKIDHRQCHFPRTVIYHLITSGYSFPSENFLEVLFFFFPLLPFF